MNRCITITKGNQYNRDGYRLGTSFGLYAFGALGRRMDGTEGITFDGTYVPRDNERAAIEAAIRATIADGVERTINLTPPQTDTAAAPMVPEWTSKRGLTLTEEMDREDSIY